VGKSDVLEHKSGNSLYLKRVKIEEKLLWRPYRNSPMLFRTVTSPTRRYGRLFPKIGGSQFQSLLAYLRKGQRYGLEIWPLYIHRVHPNKSPLKFRRKWSVSVSRDCSIF